MARPTYLAKVSGDTSAFSLDAGMGVLSFTNLSPIMNPNLNTISK